MSEKQSINKRHNKQQQCVYEVSNDISPSKMITFINLVNNTLMTNLTHLRTSSQDSNSIQQW